MISPFFFISMIVILIVSSCDDQVKPAKKNADGQTGQKWTLMGIIEGPEIETEMMDFYRCAIDQMLMLRGKIKASDVYNRQVGLQT